MTTEEHKQRHEMLHKCLDELCADYLTHTGKLLSNTTVLDFVKWSHWQTINPMEERKPDDHLRFSSEKAS